MTTLNAQTLRPGFLVSLNTSVRGNVAYQRRDIEAPHVIDETGELRARWETERTVVDPAEHDEAIKVRGKCRSLITAVCSASTFGLLCPDTAEADLQAAIAESQALAASFNIRAKLTRIGVYVIAGRVAADDVQAVRAINSEVRDLLAEMETGLQGLDVDRVRQAANKAKQLGQMLSPEAAARIQIAIDAARSVARRMVKAGETAAQEIDRRTLSTLAEARTAFLDLDDAGEIATPVAEGRAIDLEPQAAPATIATASVAPMLFELD